MGIYSKEYLLEAEHNLDIMMSKSTSNRDFDRRMNRYNKQQMRLVLSNRNNVSQINVAIEMAIDELKNKKYIELSMLAKPTTAFFIENKGYLNIGRIDMDKVVQDAGIDKNSTKDEILKNLSVRKVLIHLHDIINSANEVINIASKNIFSLSISEMPVPENIPEYPINLEFDVASMMKNPTAML